MCKWRVIDAKKNDYNSHYTAILHLLYPSIGRATNGSKTNTCTNVAHNPGTDTYANTDRTANTAFGYRQRMGQLGPGFYRNAFNTLTGPLRHDSADYRSSDDADVHHGAGDVHAYSEEPAARIHRQ